MSNHAIPYHYKMRYLPHNPRTFFIFQRLTLFLNCANYIFTLLFIIEAVLKMLALGVNNYFKSRYTEYYINDFLLENVHVYQISIYFCRWNCLDMAIVILSIGGMILDELVTSSFPINPTIIRVMRILRITRGLDIHSILIRILAIHCKFLGKLVFLTFLQKIDLK